MTRERQIVEVAKAKEKETGFGELVKSSVSRGVNSAYGIGFLEGVEWADKNPRKGLWDAEKTCQIIHEVINSDTIGQYLLFDDENIDFDSELFFDDLRRVMED